MRNSENEADALDRAPILPKAEWEAEVARVTAEMQEYTKKFATPISFAIDNDHGELKGTGNYLNLYERSYLLTNEHVARTAEYYRLGYQFLNNDSVFKVTSPFEKFRWPLDLAVSAIDPRAWTSANHGSLGITENKLAPAHTPVQGEILFFKGFSGERAHFYFGQLNTTATSYGCQEAPLPADRRIKPRFHFALDYRAERAIAIGKDTRGLPLPPGFSGSLVWNTRFVEMWGTAPRWTPDCAPVTGLVWGWPSSSACIVATRIEYVRSFLLQTVSR